VARIANFETLEAVVNRLTVSIAAFLTDNARVKSTDHITDQVRCNVMYKGLISASPRKEKTCKRFCAAEGLLGLHRIGYS